MVLERTSHQANAVCQQGRGQRIPGMALVGDTIEGEAVGATAVDLSARRDPVFLGHLLRPRERATSRASSTLEISCVSVLRVTTSHERSPASWNHNS